MADLKIKLAEGLIAVRCLDPDDMPMMSGMRGDHQIAGADQQNKACLCEVMSAGPKTSAKAGDTVMVRPWYLRDCLMLDDETCVIENHGVVGVVST